MEMEWFESLSKMDEFKMKLNCGENFMLFLSSSLEDNTKLQSKYFNLIGFSC